MSNAEEHFLTAHCTPHGLRNLEADEIENIRAELYSDLPKDMWKASGVEVEDTVQWSQIVREGFTHAAMRPLKEKIGGFREFVQILSKPQQKCVVTVFFATTLAMFTVPIIVLFFSMRFLAPAVGVDAGLCGGVMALVTTVGIMSVYVFYALCESGAGPPGTGQSAEEKKKQ